MPEVSPYQSLADIYDELIGLGFFPRLQHNFEQLERHYNLRFSSAADVACGTGLFLNYLQRRGVPKLYGVDRSLAMIRKAWQRNHGTGICLQQQNMTDLRLPHRVDLITCNFDSLNYLLKPNLLTKAFQRFAENLKPGGTLIFDMITRNQPWHSLNPLIEKCRIGNLKFVRSMRINKKTGFQCSRVIIDSPIGIRRETHIQRAYPTRLVARLLRNAGFRLLGVHDFANLRTATCRSPRIIVIAIRR